jgi:hypothetical protein
MSITNPNPTVLGLRDYNALTNGGFAVQQRVATASTLIPSVSTTTRAGQVADRWAVTVSNVATVNWAQIDSSGTPETGLLSRYYGSIVSTAQAKKVMISQWMINADMAHLRGQQVRLSVKTNQKVGAAQVYKLGLLQLNSSGTVDVSPAFLSGAWSVVDGTDPSWGTNLAAIAPDASPTVENGTITGSYLNITSGVTTWQRSSCCFTVPSTAKNLVVVLFSNITGGATDNISIAEFQLTSGAEIIPYVAAPVGEEVLLCQRFFSKSFPLTVVPAASLSEATAGSGATGLLGKSGSGTALGSQIVIQFPVQMWKTPTVTLFTPTAAGAVVFRLSGTSPLSQGTTAQRTSSLTDQGVVITATNEATTNGAVGDLVGVHYTADAELVA